MESLAFLHDAIAHEDPPLDRRFEPGSGTILATSLRGLLSFAVLLAVLNQFSLAQAALKVGDRGDRVANLQRELRINPDGVFGPETQEYVVAFQRLSGLSVTGVADNATLAALGLPPDAVGSDTPARPAAAPEPVTIRVPIPEPSNAVAVAPASAHSAVVVANTGLNVRDFPAGSVVDRLDRNQVVRLTGDRRAAGHRYWVQLASGGWVAEDFLRFSQAPGAAPSQPRPSAGPGATGAAPSGANADKARVSAQTGLIIRNAPGGAAIGSLLNGQTVQLKCGGTAHRQSANGRYWVELAAGGWVAEDYVTIN